MNRRLFLRTFVGVLFGTRCIYDSKTAFAMTDIDDDLLLVNGWIVRRSQISKDNRSQER